MPATFCSEIKPPVEYEVERLENDRGVEQTKISKREDRAKISKENRPRKLLPSLNPLAIDNEPAKAWPSTFKLFDGIIFEDENEEVEEEDNVQTDGEQKQRKSTGLKPSRVYGGVDLSTKLKTTSFVSKFRRVKVVKITAKASERSRAERGKRIGEIQNDPKSSGFQKEGTQQEGNSTERGKMKYIRHTPGSHMAHPRERQEVAEKYDSNDADS